MPGKKILYIFLCVTLLSVTLSGCVSKSNYNTLQQQYNSLKQENSTLQTNLTSAQNDYDLLKSQMATAQADWQTSKNTYEAKLDDAKNTNNTLTQNITTLNQNITTLNQNITGLQTELDKAENTEVSISYSFSYQFYHFVWNLSIPLKEYLYYSEKPRITDTSKYTTMVTDTNGDDLLNVLVNKIKDATLTYNLKPSDIANLVGAFVQSLANSDKNIATPYDDYPCYPVETLFKRGGDCEDTSILAAALLQRLAFNEVVFAFSNPKHVALGVDVAVPLGANEWEYKGTQYVYLETLGGNWTVGNAPTVYTTLQPAIYLIGK